MSIVCWLLGLWYSFGRPLGVSGHDYEQELDVEPREPNEDVSE